MTPPLQLRAALDGITALSRSVNARDEQIQQLLAHAKSLSDVVAAPTESDEPAHRRGQQLFAELSARRQAMGDADLRHRRTRATDFGLRRRQSKAIRSRLTKLNLVLDNLETTPRTHRRIP